MSASEGTDKEQLTVHAEHGTIVGNHLAVFETALAVLKRHHVRDGIAAAVLRRCSIPPGRHSQRGARGAVGRAVAGAHQNNNNNNNTPTTKKHKTTAAAKGQRVG